MNGNIRLLGASAVTVIAVMAGSSAGEAAWWKFGKQAAEPPVVLAQADAQRFDRIEAQMRTLTGQVEELTFHVRQLQEQLQRMQQDNDFRFNELEGGAPPARQSQAPAQTQQTDTIGSLAGAEEGPMEGTSGLGTPPQPLGQLVLDAPADAGGQPLDLNTLARGGEPQTAAQPEVATDSFIVASTGDPRADYDRAYNYVLSGDYPRAEASFRQFISDYPGDQLAPDAQYWLGESYFARGMYRDAADAFLTGYKTYPKAAKGPDTLLKLGLSLAGLGERQTACSTFEAVLKQYPDASNALRQRVANERASAGC